MSRNPAEITHLADLSPDPVNLRRHTPRNLGLIEDALREVGAARSIVIDEDGVVLAGNATVEAAAAAGIERVRVIDADGETIVAVRRVGLTPEQKRRLALYDNRAGELAGWDAAAIEALIDEDPEALAGIFYPAELDRLLAALPDDDDAPAALYAPALTPTAATDEITADQVVGAGDRLANRFAQPPAYVEVMCPHCAGRFAINRDQA